MGLLCGGTPCGGAPHTLRQVRPLGPSRDAPPKYTGSCNRCLAVPSVCLCCHLQAWRLPFALFLEYHKMIIPEAVEYHTSESEARQTKSKPLKCV